ncbi:S8 family peptidase [Neobacillus cucumis]|uniref:S8 family peptidase n=1 Tax=Neobacillus cucumis TaxID=1740721 RepID=UPI0019642CED|nr:S8 family peptidase [Neobacillus cucumis]MBM7650968.1 subtilisin family serine protease [Neobacillus cucumis]
MRRSVIYGLFSLGLGLILFATMRPFFLDKGEQRNNTITETNNTGRLFQVQNVQQRNGNIQRINMIKANHQLVQRLNNSPSIKVINHNKKDKSHYYKNEIVVNFKTIPPQEKINQYLKDINGTLRERHETVYNFKSKSQTTNELEKYFIQKQSVEYAEPHYIFLPNEVNDTYYQSYQWNLPAIGTEKGWNMTRGSKNVKIAVVDTGVDLDHPDLAHRLIAGYNAIDNNNNPDDDNGHGSHVAGIIAADTNNGEGMAGITWYNPIIPVKVMDAEGTGGSFYVAKGIRWAVDHGADVINLSLGNYQSCDILESAIDYALEKNVVVVSAAGNDNTSQRSYPAAYPGVLGVAAVDSDGKRANFSNFGDYVDVAAPGVEIPSTFSNGEYAALSGTSMAAPHVAALAGLIRSINPNLKNTDVTKIITSSAQGLNSNKKSPYFGNGIINNLEALQMAAKNKK